MITPPSSQDKAQMCAQVSEKPEEAQAHMGTQAQPDTSTARANWDRDKSGNGQMPPKCHEQMQVLPLQKGPPIQLQEGGPSWRSRALPFSTASCQVVIESGKGPPEPSFPFLNTPISLSCSFSDLCSRPFTCAPLPFSGHCSPLSHPPHKHNFN